MDTTYRLRYAPERWYAGLFASSSAFEPGTPAPDTSGSAAPNAAANGKTEKRLILIKLAPIYQAPIFIYPREILVQPSLENGKKRHRIRITIIIFCTCGVAIGATLWVAQAYLFPKTFNPVQLTTREQKVLDNKIQTLTAAARHTGEAPSMQGRLQQDRSGGNGHLEPERYSEKDADRQIQLTERELNALLAKNTDLAQKLAIDLSDDLASAKLLVPLDSDFPFLGGKTLRVTAGIELRYRNKKPVVILRGVSIWGVPIPNAWLGGIKNIDLVNEFGMERGFWRTFAAGVEDIRIVDGRLSIILKE
jgi:hypothetical protein